ncbi:MAG: hypothetical protein IJS96_04265 [Schwartzia sp.]|nr:hypothetical protein [Schwartzia sp. (in: firmicutes)]
MKFIKRLFKRIFGAIWRFIKRVFFFFANLIGLLFTLAFCLYVYIGVKGFTYLMHMKYQTVPSVIPLLLDLGLEGIVGIVAVVVTGYFLSPRWHMGAAVLTLLLCSGFNGFNIWRIMNGQLTDLPLLEAIIITSLAFIFGLVTCLELRRYKRRKALEAAAVLATAEAAESAA